MNDTPTPRLDKRKASFALDTIRQLETELAAVTEQRDEAREQRDRLAEAIRKYTGGCYPESFLFKTLRSLNPK